MIKIKYKKTTTTLYFIFVLLQALLAILGLYNGHMGWILFVIFIFHNFLWTVNFIELFRKKIVLIITNEFIEYSLYNIYIDTKDILYINDNYGYLKIHLKENINKYELTKSFIGKILMTGGLSNYSNKHTIIILKYGLDINERKFENTINSIKSIKVS